MSGWSVSSVPRINLTRSHGSTGVFGSRGDRNAYNYLINLIELVYTKTTVTSLFFPEVNKGAPPPRLVSFDVVIGML